MDEQIYYANINFKKTKTGVLILIQNNVDSIEKPYPGIKRSLKNDKVFILLREHNHLKYLCN